MPRYDELYERLAMRAVRSTAVDMETFMDNALASGMSRRALEQRLMDDLVEGGPLFNKFLHSVVGAAESAVATAQRQGTLIAESEDALRQLERFSDLGEEGINALLNDPGAMAEAEFELAEVVLATWVAELVNTCEYCLPLHGVSMPLSEWTERGLDPSTIHAEQGWNTPCHCQLVTSAVVPQEIRAPLARVSLETKRGLEGNRRTARAVAQADIDRALAARDKALQSEKGRRTLRLLGQAKQEKTEE